MGNQVNTILWQFLRINTDVNRKDWQSKTGEHEKGTTIIKINLRSKDYLTKR